MLSFHKIDLFIRNPGLEKKCNNPLAVIIIISISKNNNDVLYIFYVFNYIVSILFCSIAVKFDFTTSFSFSIAYLDTTAAEGFAPFCDDGTVILTKLDGFSSTDAASTRQ